MELYILGIMLIVLAGICVSIILNRKTRAFGIAGAVIIAAAGVCSYFLMQYLQSFKSYADLMLFWILFAVWLCAIYVVAHMIIKMALKGKTRKRDAAYAEGVETPGERGVKIAARKVKVKAPSMGNADIVKEPVLTAAVVMPQTHVIRNIPKPVVAEKPVEEPKAVKAAPPEEKISAVPPVIEKNQMTVKAVHMDAEPQPKVSEVYEESKPDRISAKESIIKAAFAKETEEPAAPRITETVTEGQIAAAKPIIKASPAEETEEPAAPRITETVVEETEEPAAPRITETVVEETEEPIAAKEPIEKVTVMENVQPKEGVFEAWPQTEKAPDEGLEEPAEQEECKNVSRAEESLSNAAEMQGTLVEEETKGAEETAVMAAGKIKNEAGASEFKEKEKEAIIRQVMMISRASEMMAQRKYLLALELLTACLKTAEDDAIRKQADMMGLECLIAVKEYRQAQMKLLEILNKRYAMNPADKLKLKDMMIFLKTVDGH